MALAGGAGFLLLGGPRRVLRAATSRIFPARRDPYDGLLPDEVERILQGLGRVPTNPVSGRRSRRISPTTSGARAGSPSRRSATTSLWRTYDALVGPLGTVGARMLVERLFAADRGRKPRRPAGQVARRGTLGRAG